MSNQLLNSYRYHVYMNLTDHNVHYNNYCPFMQNPIPSGDEMKKNSAYGVYT